jgi:DNA-binding transcriptional ArsR family regulator
VARLKHGEKPEYAKEETDYCILNSLRQAGESGGFRFNDLLGNTKLSRDTLSKHLRALFDEKLIYHNYLTKHYSISHNGLKKIEMYDKEKAVRAAKSIFDLQSINKKDIEELLRERSFKLGDVLLAINEFLTEYLVAAKSAGLFDQSFHKADYEILRRYVTFSVYSNEPLKETKTNTSAKKLMWPQKLLFIFAFDRDRFVGDSQLSEFSHKLLEVGSLGK